MHIIRKILLLAGFFSGLFFIMPLYAAEANDSPVAVETDAIDDTTGIESSKISDLPDELGRLSTESTLTESFVTPNTLTDPSILIIDASKNMLDIFHETERFMREEYQNVDSLKIETILVGHTIATWNKESPLGLMAYGVNGNSNCNDISLLQPIDTINQDAFLNKLNQLKAKGESPYMSAVQSAAKLLDHRNNKTNIILISGSRDSCDPNPCASVRALKKAGKNLTAHVISFNTPEEDTEGLRCLAQETGGIYLEATTPDELKIALNEIKTIVTQKPILKLADASVLVDPEEKIVAGSLFEINWEGPENSTDKLIIKSEKQEKFYHYQYLGNAIRVSPSQLIAPELEGTYEVHYQLGDGRSLAKAIIKVVPAQANINTNKQTLAKTLLQINWSGPKNLYDKMALFDLETEQPLFSFHAFRNQDKSPTIIETPNKLGHYEIRYLTSGNKVLAYAPLDIVPAIIDSPLEVTSGSIFNVKWVGPHNRLDNIAIFDINNHQLASTPVFRMQDVSPAKLTAPGKLGEYQVRYQTENNTILAKQNITIIAASASIGADGEVIAGATFNVNWIGPDNAGDTIAVYDPQTHKRYDFTYFSGKNISSPAFIAAPEQAGNYEVRYISNNYALASQSILVVPAKATINTVEIITAGYKFYVNWTGPKNNRDMIALFNSETNKSFSPAYVTGKEIHSPTALTAPMAAGTYEVRYYTKGGNTLASQIIQVINEIDEDEMEENDITPLKTQETDTLEENKSSEANIIKN